MLILSNVSDENGGGEGGTVAEINLDSEYQTASELFDLMTRKTQFDANDVDSLTTQDLVLLYKNIDVGTKLMTDANEIKLKKPNQHVETIVYNDELESDSELSEIYSAEDLFNVFAVNQERLDFLNDKSLDNLLGQKFGGIEINTSNLSTSYDKNFLFKDPYIKNQLININPLASCNEFDKLFSTSLIDYICCKRLEDNYNFYMDNIIRYVQHTIEQLKRISNGDYLTDRAKEKWREVNSNEQEKNTKVLATSTSIPLHVQCKSNESATWDDIVHSEVDVRSLSKILEKKIVVEIPKMVCGSYRLFSKRYADNLIISCHKEQHNVDEQQSRLDVVLQLQRSQTGQVISNISSIMILRAAPALQDLRQKDILSLPYKEETDDIDIPDKESKSKESTLIDPNKTDVVVTELIPETKHEQIKGDLVMEHQKNENRLSKTDDLSSECEQFTSIGSIEHSGETSFALKDVLAKPMYPLRHEATYNMISPDELRVAMRRLSMQKSVLEESGEEFISPNISKRRSPIRVRVKSPYENKSYLLEEKKRKRLLEIRERREKKKIALIENCKISKHKYGKGAIMPQASSSVTKLSITNKSFYNSIYGDSANLENKLTKLRPPSRKGQNISPILTIEESHIKDRQDKVFESAVLTPDKKCEKYMNRNYDFDDETETMFSQATINDNTDVQHLISPSDSVMSNEFDASFNNLLTEIIKPPSYINLNNDLVSFSEDRHFTEEFCSIKKSSIDLLNSVNSIPLTPPIKKGPSGDECRESIDQLYDLIKKNVKPIASPELRRSKSKMKANIDSCDGFGDNSNIQGSDSGTSITHHGNLTSTHTGFSTDKNNNRTISVSNKGPMAVVPKVIISSKLQAPEVKVDKMKKDRRRVTINPPVKGISDNPLKAISQLLHEFDNVQKTKQKPAIEMRQSKKSEVVLNDVKKSSRQEPYRRRSRLEQHLKENEQERKVISTHNALKDKRTKPMTPSELARIPHQLHAEDKHFDKVAKKKLADIIDEAKEARGEAVRGPSKLNSRLNSLAQPKKSYVQAHHEEYQNRYGRNLLAVRLQRLATATTATPDRNSGPSVLKNKGRKGGGDTLAMIKQPVSSALYLDKRAKTKSPRRSASSSPSYQRAVIPDAPETNKRMVAVESYVNSHYGPRSPSPPSPTGLKCRVPLIPLDLELASTPSSPLTDEANELGNTLHRMVDSVLTNPPPPPLSSLTECEETASKDETIPEDVILCDPRSDSDYNINNLEDKDLKTAVETVDKNTKFIDLPICLTPSHYHLRPMDSTTELEKLENALYTQISGAFQNRLRIKNLTLTPKHSMQQVFLVQSGDAGSLLLKSTVSNIKINKCSVESLHEIKTIPVLSNTHLDWTFTQIPMQLATVGYAFPEYKASTNLTSSKSKLNVASADNFVQMASTSDKISQCFKGSHQKVTSEMGAQVNLVETFPAKGKEVVTVSVGCHNSHTMVSEPSESIPISTNSANDSISVLKNEYADSDIKNEVVRQNNDVKEKETQVNNSTRTPRPESVEYTTSLDMLVGLLNEIQKITCQSQMATADKPENCADSRLILKYPVAQETTENKICDLISLSSLDNLRQVDSNASISTYNLSMDGIATGLEPVREDDGRINYDVLDELTNLKFPQNRDENVMTDIFNPTRVDKEVSANLYQKECVNTLRDISSSLVPLTVDTINFKNSVVFKVVDGEFADYSEPSINSTLFSDYQTLYSNTLFRTPSIEKLTETNVNDQRLPISRDKTDLNEICSTTIVVSKHDNIVIKTDRQHAAQELRKFCVENIDFDPMLKIKRDILVTVYSILVLTVFAALSFPELIMLQ